MIITLFGKNMEARVYNSITPTEEDILYEENYANKFLYNNRQIFPDFLATR